MGENRMNRLFLWGNKTLAVTALLSLLFSGQLQAEDIARSFDMAPGGLIKLNTDVGSIEVNSHSKSRVEVKVEIDGLDPDEFTVSFDQQGSTLIIKGERNGGGWGWGSRKVHFDITLPKEFNLDLRTAGGSIRVDDLKGEVLVNTSGGSLYFGHIEGLIDGRTSGGSVTVEGARGKVNLRTSGGSLTIGDIDGDIYGRTSGGSIQVGSVSGETDVATAGGSIHIENAGGKVTAKTSGGSVSLTLSQQPKNDSEVSTSGGSITLRMASNIAVNLDARGNKVRSDFAVNGKTEAKYKLKGPINGGGPELELHTSAGNVYIKKL
jgi:HSP20 family molecular chaperone IbpA/carbon monoxide dehydrogenase subunit G